MCSKWMFEIRGKIPVVQGFLWGLVPIILGLSFWFLLTIGEPEERKISPTILPSPVEIVNEIPSLIQKNLGLNTYISFKRVIYGFLIALAISLPLGIAMGSFGLLKAIFSHTTLVSGYIPIATLVPLTLSWFGTGEIQKILFLALAFVIYLLPLVIKSIEDVPEVYVKTSWTLGASKWQMVYKVLIPIALPNIWHSMRLAFAIGWSYLAMTEVVVMQNGLGCLIEFGRRRGPKEHIYLVIILIALIALFTDKLWYFAGKKLFAYKGSK